MRPKILVIGAGSVSKYHIEAATKVGYEVFGILATPGSTRVKDVAQKYDIKNVYNEISEVKKGVFDCVLIAIPSSEIFKIYCYVIELDIPILIEKPGSDNLSSLIQMRELKHSRSMFAYNRRYYSSVQKIKTEISKYDNYLVQILISEHSWSSEASRSEKLFHLENNSVHYFDLALFLFGRFNYRNFQTPSKENPFAISAQLYSNENYVGNMSISFGIPVNSSFDIYLPGEHSQLKPIEHYQKFQSIEMIAPSKSFPVKRYIPKESGNFILTSDDLNFKPGFVEMYRDFWNLLDFKNPQFGANFESAIESLNISSQFVNQMIQGQ
jgi:predicted dehydrogenase